MGAIIDFVKWDTSAYTGEIDPLIPFEIDPPFGDAK